MSRAIDLWIVEAKISGRIRECLRQDVELLRQHGQPTADEVRDFTELRSEIYEELRDAALDRIARELGEPTAAEVSRGRRH